MVKHLVVAVAVGVLLSACGGSDNKKQSNSSSSTAVSSKASSAAVSSVASSAAVSSAASSAVVSSAVSSVAVSSSSSSAVVVSSSSSSVVVSSSSSSVVASSSSSSVASSSGSSVANEVYDWNDFEADEAGAVLSVAGWDGDAAASGTATVVNIADISGIPANGESVKAVKFVGGNWNAGIKLTFTMPAGKTLADYNIVFDVYFPRTTPAEYTGGDNNYYKDLFVAGGATVSSGLNETNGGYLGKLATEGNVDAWHTFTFTPSAAAETITGTFELAFGINRPAGSATDYYLVDNVGLELK